MNDDETTEVLKSLDELWFSKEKLTESVKTIWGAELCRHDHPQVLRAIVALTKTSKWRPCLAEILAAMREGNLRQSKRVAIADAERPALAPAPPVSHEFLAELTASIKESTRPTKLSNMIESEPRKACGRTGERRRWGAIALDVLTDWLKEGNGAAADALDEVARRAAD